MTDHLPYRRTIAVMERIFGRDIGDREFTWLLVLANIGGMTIGVAAFLVLPPAGLVLILGAAVAGLIWMIAVLRAYTGRSS